MTAIRILYYSIREVIRQRRDVVRFPWRLIVALFTESEAQR